MSIIRTLTLCGALALTLTGIPHARAAEYKLHVLPVPAGHVFSAANRINEAGQVIGFSSVAAEISSLYLWDSQGPRYIGRYGSNYSDINNSGTIVTGSYVWSNGKLSQRPALYEETPYYNRFHDITDSGKIVGSSPTAYPPDEEVYHAALWDETGIHDLGALPGSKYSIANAINDHDQIVGESGSSYWPQAVIWNAGGISAIPLLAGYDYSSARDINNSGLVAGNCWRSASQTPGTTRGFIWQNGQFLDFFDWSDKSGNISAVNDRGQVVGTYTQTGYSTPTAYVWENGVLTKLPTLGRGAVATSINENGWIVGRAWGNDKKMHAIVWEPVPEPSSILTLIVGLTGAVALRCNRRSRPT